MVTYIPSEPNPSMDNSTQASMVVSYATIQVALTHFFTTMVSNYDHKL